MAKPTKAQGEPRWFEVFSARQGCREFHASAASRWFPLNYPGGTATIRDFVGGWRWLAVRGATAILFGVAALLWPAVTLWALMVLWAVFAFADGVFSLGGVLAGNIRRNRGWWAFRGLAGVAIGIITFLWPSITALALLMVIAAWAFITGLAQIVIAVFLRRVIRHEWVLGALGTLSTICGIVLVVNPSAGAVAVAWIIGWYALVFGLMLFALAWEVRRESLLLHASRM